MKPKTIIKKTKTYLFAGSIFAAAHTVYAVEPSTGQQSGDFTNYLSNSDPSVYQQFYNPFSPAFKDITSDLSALGNQTGEVVKQLEDIDKTLESDLGDIGETLKKILRYIKNMGLYFGYNLEKYCTPDGKCADEKTEVSVSNQMVNLKESFQSQYNLISSSLGAMLPSGTLNAGFQQVPFVVVPPNNESIKNYEWIFKLSNQSFKNFNQVSPSNVSVSNLIDQMPYQTDPVSQNLLNLLGTPNDSFCFDKNKGVLINPCIISGADGTPVLSQSQVAINLIGGFPPKESYPSISNFSSPAFNASLVSQLSSDSLLGPLMFDTSSENSKIQQPKNTAGGRGLTAQNQAQNAANFIRYASGMAVPLQLPNKDEYTALYIKAAGLIDNIPPAEQTQAQIIIANYLANLRIYAAQTSVGISNLYYILSKRMPLSTNPQGEGSENNGQQTSQALSEYVMATRRLQVPSDPKQLPWFNQINNGSPATVQKEMALLLAEINYQLYLTRMQQERLLLTNTMILLQHYQYAGTRQLPKLEEETTQSETGLFTTQ